MIAAREVVAVVTNWSVAQSSLASDYWIITDATKRWLAGGPFYEPAQLAGPYGWEGRWILYPPPLLLVLVPLALVPWPVWWLAPIGVTAWALTALRPRPLALGVIAMCLANASSIAAIYWGNPVMFFVAALALATRYGWPAVAIFLKPTLLPFAFFGIWRRSWWVAAGLGLAISLAFLPMWFDYVTVLRNGSGVRGLLYSLPQVPLMVIPIAAALGTREPAARRSEIPTSRVVAIAA